MNWGRRLVIVIVIVILGFGIFGLFRERRDLGKEVEEMRANLRSLTEENKDLAAKIEYFKNPANLVKEIKSQFNYRQEGEKIIIIVPSATSTSE